MNELPAELKGSVAAGRDENSFLVRIRLPGGLTDPEKLAGIARIAQEFGISMVHISSNQTVELLQVVPSCLENLAAELKKNGTPIDNAVRNRISITACPGTASCPHALIDTFSFTGALQRYSTGKEPVPKVRIAVSGCPNSCSNERECEIGVTGIRKPQRDAVRCTGCGGCLSVCLEDAIIILNGKLELDEEKCLLCGQCLSACQYDCISFSDAGYLIFLGGKSGRKQKTARAFGTVQSKDELIAVLEVLSRIFAKKGGNASHILRSLSDEEFKGLQKEVAFELEKTGVTLQPPPKAYQ